MTHNKSPRRINHKATKSKTNTYRGEKKTEVGLKKATIEMIKKDLKKKKKKKKTERKTSKKSFVTT